MSAFDFLFTLFFKFVFEGLVRENLHFVQGGVIASALLKSGCFEGDR